MKILNFLFSRSKQEQDKPIRDKLKTRKDFERVLAEDLDIMETTKARIDTAKNINLYMYRSLSYSYILILQSKYSVDAKIDELRDIYIKSMYYFLTGDDGKMYYSVTDTEHTQKIRDYCQKLCSVGL